jgi:hypothetical protein
MKARSTSGETLTPALSLGERGPESFLQLIRRNVDFGRGPFDLLMKAER